MQSLTEMLDAYRRREREMPTYGELRELVTAWAARPSWVPLADTQWMNIVNHDHAYHSFSKDDAVHEAVKRTEAKLRELNAPVTPNPTKDTK